MNIDLWYSSNILEFAQAVKSSTSELSEIMSLMIKVVGHHPMLSLQNKNQGVVAVFLPF